MSRKKAPAPASVDHLAEAAAGAGLSQAAIASVRGWIAELMMADEYAKLGQAGHAKTEVPLRHVFVDLPVASKQADSRSRTPFLQQFLGAEPVPLKGRLENVGAEPTDGEDRGRPDRPLDLGAALLIGGPGQGKSTLGQFACQLHRAALLLPVESTLSARECEVLATFKGSSSEEEPLPGLALPGNPLLPVHVALPELAAWLAGRDAAEGDSSLEIFAFVTSRPSAKKFSLSSEVLLELAAHLPILLVLDGFDEVGAAKDREGIVSAARELIETLAKFGARAKILATTRPQGYAGELSRIGLPLGRQDLLPLEPKEAMAYAHRLIPTPDQVGVP